MSPSLRIGLGTADSNYCPPTSAEQAGLAASQACSKLRLHAANARDCTLQHLVSKYFTIGGTFLPVAGFESGIEAFRAAQGDNNSAEFTAGATLMAVILVVEDDAFIMQSLGWILEDLGHDMLCAHDLGTAMAQLAAKQLIDALFVDIRLGTLTLGGYGVADQAVALRPDLAVLYTSGSPLTLDMTERFVPGGHFLQKPYSPIQVEASIAEILH